MDCGKHRVIHVSLSGDHEVQRRASGYTADDGSEDRGGPGDGADPRGDRGADR